MNSRRAGTLWARGALIALSVGCISETQAQRITRAERAELLRQIPEETLITFAPEHTRRRVTVFNRVDAIVVPSVWVENSPLVIHEAQQARVPVITAATGAE